MSAFTEICWQSCNSKTRKDELIGADKDFSVPKVELLKLAGVIISELESELS